MQHRLYSRINKQQKRNKIMPFLIIIFIAIILGIVILLKQISNQTKNENYPIHSDIPQGSLPNNKDEYKNSYERKYLMTLNEKAQFKKIKEWADKNGFIVFTKVRLLDLITPKKDISNFKGALWKIQAKHIDFLICDSTIRVKCIIEIDDNSHKQKERIERDTFVTDVLNACGYKILHTYNITDEELNKICNISTQPDQTRQE